MNPAKIHGLRTHGMAVNDVKAATAWYSEYLGVEPYFVQRFYVGFDIAGYELGIYPNADAPTAPNPRETITYWEIDDVAGMLERAVARGAVVIEEARDVGGDITVGAFRDPFGNNFGWIRNPNFAPPVVAAAGLNLRPDPIVLELTVAAAPSTCFAAWTSAEGLAAWWATHTRIDLRVGGHFELYMMDENPAGTRGSERCRILSYLPDRMVSFTWNAPPTLSNTRDQHTWVVLEFSPVGSGTHVRLTHTGWPADAWDTEPQWAETHAYFARAWALVLDRFRAKFGEA